MIQQYKARGIRGAITVNENTDKAIQQATLELLTAILKENNVIEDDIASVIFTVTDDLNAEFPAKTARINLGWNNIPMLCAQELPVPDSIPMCIRVLITINTTLEKNEINHVYLGNAQKLRPDLVKE